VKRVALDRWSLWGVACLRAAGFAARGVLDLAASELAATTDRLLDAEAIVAHDRDALAGALRSAERADPTQRQALGRAHKRLAQHRVPEEPLADAAAEAARVRLVEATRTQTNLAGELAAQYEQARRATSAALRAAAADERFRRAIVWQNRSLLHTMLDWIARQPADADDSPTRRKEHSIATYVQRYCVKNDTIGFFGPAGWARLVDDREPLVMRPGAALIAFRAVSYEYSRQNRICGRRSRRGGCRNSRSRARRCATPSSASPSSRRSSPRSSRAATASAAHARSPPSFVRMLRWG
jgi:hypothetical protein